MKAIVINRHGGPEVLESARLPIPEAQPGEVLLRVAAAAVNPADCKWRAGMFQAFMPVSFPHVLGYDVAAEVVGGDGFAPGIRVFGMLDPIRKGGYAEYVAAPAEFLAEIPGTLDFATAAAIATAGLTGLQMVERGVNVQPGQSVLITGALGAVGRFALHFAKERGAYVVCAVRAAHRDAVMALGADMVLTLGEGPLGGAPFDHVIDTVGGEAVGRLCVDLKPGGRIVTAATTPIPADGLPASPEFFAVTPSSGDLQRLGQAVVSGAIEVPVAQIMPLDQVAEAHRLVEQGGQGGKIILAP
ncbi:NADP-dependent oxidoreductase [Sphingobium yanoikuyae]|uniref:Alcohol dehydrogenase n=1 Tax=Sphingobium yanoikuyae TaxID=13690 RepID=A0A291N064_SPHYA|nr:NADP-dependent oxidoreductase [Sphingobium yanoikuyae]ATI80742.1 alcohol dehydrogenase [Sphingobium yanoikuyae]